MRSHDQDWLAIARVLADQMGSRECPAGQVHGLPGTECPGTSGACQRRRHPGLCWLEWASREARASMRRVKET